MARDILHVRSTSSVVMLQYMPLLKPLYDIEVWSGITAAIFVANPSKLRVIVPARPTAPPWSMASMAVPQNMPNAVRNVRVLFRDRVAPISRQLSRSKIASFMAIRRGELLRV